MMLKIDTHRTNRAVRRYENLGKMGARSDNRIRHKRTVFVSISANNLIVFRNAWLYADVF